MGNNSRASVPLGQLNAIQGFSKCADLVDFNQNGICNSELDALSQESGVGDKEIVAHKLHARTQALSQGLPSGPVVLRHAILYRNDWILVSPLRPVLHHLST